MTCKILKRSDKYQYFEVIKRNRAKRTRYGRIYLEGVIPINCALAAGWEIEAVIHKLNAQLSDWAREILARCQAAERFELSDELMDELSGKEHPSELILIAIQRDRKLSNLAVTPGQHTLILDRPSNPGNLGAVIRTADSFGIDAVLISGHSCDLFDPKTISASRGTVFSLPVYKAGSNKQLEKFFISCLEADSAYCLYGSSARGTVIGRDMERADSWSLVIGNETDGMNVYFREKADRILTLPMSGTASSLNMACAASILMFSLLYNY